MQDVNVVIVFYSRTGATERLALTAAVGAVEAKAFIRLRRIAEPASEETMASVPGWRENHDRMNKEYIAPREADTHWAEGLVVVIPDWMDPSAPEVKSYLDTLAGRIFEGKIAAALGREGLQNALAAAGLVTLPATAGGDALERARIEGARVAEAVRAARQK